MQPPAPNNELVIRTMKDDTNQMHPVPVVPALAAINATPAFPLPSKQEKRVEIQPQRKSRTQRNILVGILCVVLLGGLTAAGWYGYRWWAVRQTPETVPVQKRPVAEMIPKEAIAVVAYPLDSQLKRTSAKLFWDAKSPSNQGSAIDGDVRELLGIQDITGAYYVIMQDTQRPFLLLEKTPLSEQYVATQRTIVPVEKDGWYIMNRIGGGQYLAALDRGTLAENGEIPALRSSTAVAQYILTAPYASKLFNDMASDALGLSRVAALTFEVESSAQDGTIRAQATTPTSPTDEKLVPSLEEITKLIPGDIEFSHIGFNFADDLDAWQQETARLDSDILQQPAIRQFISLLKTPYALLKRTGSDGVRDIGLIIQLPEDLQKGKLKTGEPIIEQTLPAFIPLIVGKPISIQSAFHDGAYESIPVRYTNITGQTQALDYMVGDSFILISSSREGMGALIDIALGKGEIFKDKDPWKQLFEKSAAAIEGETAFFGRIQDPLFLSLMPIASTISKVPVVLTQETTSTDHILHATLLTQQ